MSLAHPLDVQPTADELAAHQARVARLKRQALLELQTAGLSAPDAIAVRSCGLVLRWGEFACEWHGPGTVAWALWARNIPRAEYGERIVAPECNEAPCSRCGLWDVLQRGLCPDCREEMKDDA